MTSTDNKKNNYLPIVSILFWIGLWQLVAVIINNSVFLPSPLQVAKALGQLMTRGNFYLSILYTFSKILLGFILALVTGLILGFLSYRYKLIKEIITVPLAFMKSVPVASFVILLLLWTDAERLSIIISFFMGLPVITENLLTGLEETDTKLLEMAESFQMTKWNKVKLIYYHQALPYFKRGLSTASGLMFKAGIAGEVIGLPKNSIGESLYLAKLYLSTDQVFAYTAVIILLSLIFQKFLEFLLEERC